MVRERFSLQGKHKGTFLKIQKGSKSMIKRTNSRNDKKYTKVREVE